MGQLELFSPEMSLSKFNKSITYKNPKDEWYTPVDIIRRFCTIEDGTWMDPATTLEVAERQGFKKFYTIETDGLKNEWEGNIWCNPPFSLKDEFINKAREYVERTGNKVFMLLPASLETKIWQSAILGRARIFIPNKRIKFDNPALEKQKGSSFTSLIVEFTKDECYEYRNFEI